jgi:hypothetical protein
MRDEHENKERNRRVVQIIFHAIIPIKQSKTAHPINQEYLHPADQPQPYHKFYNMENTQMRQQVK